MSQSSKTADGEEKFSYKDKTVTNKAAQRYKPGTLKTMDKTNPGQTSPRHDKPWTR
jgi:hypothetical protein